MIATHTLVRAGRGGGDTKSPERHFVTFLRCSETNLVGRFRAALLLDIKGRGLQQ
jgi:hypothetical protein